MKRFIYAILCASAFAFALTGCSKNNGNDDNPINPEKPWLGKWIMKGDKSMVGDFNASGKLTFSLVNEPSQREIEIKEISGDDVKVEIYGLSPTVPDAIGLAKITDNKLSILYGVKLNPQDNGTVPTWTMQIVNNGEIFFVRAKDPTPAVEFTMESDLRNAKGVWDSGELSDGSTYSAVAVEVMAVTNGGCSYYGEEDKFPAYYPTGNVTLVRK